MMKFAVKSAERGVGYYSDDAAPAKEAEFVRSELGVSAVRARIDLPPGVVEYNGKKCAF